MDTQARAAEQQAVPPQAVILQTACGTMMSQALGVAARLGIADLLRDGPRSSADLAEATSSHESSLFRILRSLAAAGIFREAGPQTFVNTPASEMLLSDVPNSMRNCAIFMAEPWHTEVWANMPHSVRTGETVWNKTHGADVFDWFGANPEAAEVFNNTMTEMSAGTASEVVEAYDFTGIGTLADIAGGHGYILSQILNANSEMQGILFDLPQVIDGSAPLLQKHGVADRVEKTTGDFFKAVPAADAYIMKHIIHDWDDEKATLILRNIHAAMNGSGKVLLVETVIPEGNDPHWGKLIDLEMLTSTGGLERTEEEYRDLFANAGFRLNRIVPTRSPFSIIEAVKA